MAAAKRKRSDLVLPGRPPGVVDAEVDAVIDAWLANNRLPYSHPTVLPQDVVDELRLREFTVLARREVQ